MRRVTAMKRAMNQRKVINQRKKKKAIYQVRMMQMWRLALIKYALTLDVEGTMEQRQNRTGEGHIKIKKQLQPDENTHTFMMLTTLSMGYDCQRIHGQRNNESC